MIPILYDSNETEFSSNGLGRLRDTISATVIEERNGIYELSFDYPIDGVNYDKITLGRIVGVSHDESMFLRNVQYNGALTDENDNIITDENGAILTGTGTKQVFDRDIQPFDIVGYSRPINGVVTFYGVHISYRQSKIVTYGNNVNSLADAFNVFDTVSFPDNPFTYMTDMASTGYVAAFDGTPRTVRSLLGGVEGSILDAYGGEYEWDKWVVRLHSARGQQRDFSIRYGVNLTDFQDDADYSESYNTCIPYWSSGDVIVVGSEVFSGQGTVGVDNKCVPLDLTDKFESQPTTAELETMAMQIMNAEQSYLPLRNIKVDFVRLQDDSEFGRLSSLFKCRLCDSIKVIFPKYDMSAYFKIVKTVWNVLLDRYDEIELGSLSLTLGEALGLNK